MKNRLVTLLTDFDIADHYVASMKAAIYKENNNAVIVDLSHKIQPYNILEASYVLGMAYQDFPEDTIFVCVVDPGVGSKRLSLVFKSGPYYFVGPDNGIFSAIFDQRSDDSIYVIDDKDYDQNNNRNVDLISPTFHGRDIFAPCAAQLSLGKEVEELGSKLQEPPVQISELKPQINETEGIIGRLIREDSFGNLQSNIHKRDVEAYKNILPFSKIEDSTQQKEDAIQYKEDLTQHKETSLVVQVGEKLVPLIQFYEQGLQDNVFAIWGSSGFMELSIKNGRAGDYLTGYQQKYMNISIKCK